MNKIKVLNARRCVAVFMAMLITVLSLSYTNNNRDDVMAASKTRTYLRHNYTSSEDDVEYQLTVNPENKSRTIFPPNDMVRDTDTAVVRLDGVGGTGFIVGEHEIATAAHCVYNKGFLDFKISIIDENNKVIKTISPHYVHINKNYSPLSNYIGDKSIYDYAMIYVDEDLSQYGKFNLGVALDSYADKNGSVIVSGFPGEYPDDYKGADWGIRFKAKGNIIGHNLDAFNYNADTFGGTSGGPVYIEEGITTVDGKLHEYKTAIAIHKTSGNWGAKITSELLKFYKDNPYKTN
ncbi:MAG: trypsin-like peptidase domain-containing protein [Ruminococcus sp.]|nr:trypsin-like peptidase domain-containing protein [Ruminococcus sp.]